MKWIFTIFMAGALACQAATYYVATNGNDSTGLGTLANPWLTISNGVKQVTSAGDVVLVANGVYMLTTNITVTNAITLRGLDRTNTIIQGYYPAISNQGLYINNSGATVEEFTVRNFGISNNNGYGGGVSLGYGTLQKCIIASNIAYLGGGIYNASGLVSGCEISFNKAVPAASIHASGGGIYNLSGVVTGCVINANTANAYGGGIATYLNGQIWNCTIASNICLGNSGGGGLYMGDTGIVANSAISNNTSWMFGGGCYLVAAGVISNCTVANNLIPAGASANTFGAGISGGKAYSCFIRNNTNLAFFGGGVHNAVYLQDCTIEGNYSAGGGSGIGLNSSSMFLTNCTITSNIYSSTAGGSAINCDQYDHAGLTAVWCRVVGNVSLETGTIKARGNIMLDHCVIERNLVGYYGGGIYLRANSQAQVRNCLIAGNRYSNSYSGYASGGGVYIKANSTNCFSACTVAGNFFTGSETYGGGIYLEGDGSDTFTNCIIASNNANASKNIYMTTSARSNAFYYSCSDRLTNTAQGNTTNNPLFLDAAATNYHLAKGSPGINAGTKEGWMTGAVDLDRRTRADKFSGKVDMGAYEYMPQGAVFSGH